MHRFVASDRATAPSEVLAKHPRIPGGRAASYSSYAVSPTMRQLTLMRVVEIGVLTPAELKKLRKRKS